MKALLELSYKLILKLIIFSEVLLLFYAYTYGIGFYMNILDGFYDRYDNGYYIN